MNPLTLVKRIQNINAKEASLGISEDASWHAKYKDSAYVFVGGVPFDLTEGDLLAVFAQYGEIVDVNLVRDKGTGKSKGFAFVAYEDQRSTNLAVDNLNGAQVLGRTIRVDHVTKYKKKEEEDEEEAQQKREERGVCRAFQRGECTRGDGCKFSHNEQRAAHTGWGEKDKEEKWGHDRFGGPKKDEERGVCFAFQRGECTRGAGCKFSHDEQRANHTGRGEKDKDEKRGHDRFRGPKNDDRRSGNGSRSVQEGDRGFRFKGKDIETLERELKQSNKREEKRYGSHDDDYDAKTRGRDNRSPRGHKGHDHQPKSRKHDEDDDEVLPKSRGLERREESGTRRPDSDKGEDVDRREGKRSRRHDDYEQRSRDRRSDRDALEPRLTDSRRNEERVRRRDVEKLDIRSREDDERSGDRRYRAR